MCLVHATTMVSAQGYKPPKPANSRTVLLEKEAVAENQIKITEIKNTSTHDIIFGYKIGPEDIHENWKSIEIAEGATNNTVIICYACYCCEIGSAGLSSERNLCTPEDIKKLWMQTHPNQAKPVTTPTQNTSEVGPKTVEREPKTVERAPETGKRQSISTEEGIAIFTRDWLNEKGWCRYYSDKAVLDDSTQIYSMIALLKSDPTEEVISDAKSLLEEKRAELDSMRLSLSDDIQHKYIDEYKQNPLEDPVAVKEGIVRILQEKIESRQVDLSRLESLIVAATEKKPVNYVYIISGGVVLLLIILIISLVFRSKKNKTASQVAGQRPAEVANEIADPNLVIIRKTTSAVLKTQNIDDVIDNDAYLKIECGEFAADSAVSCMYLKNSCIKDIYNLYAEDLRNPENPKEDGCMVIGRWVFDKNTEKYAVTLEEVVRPGDDAIFKEYELNFGGKIKLKVSERLRKLRRDTDLQYDLTCWVHSHPGLGVFFSNSDSGVQMQLKHPAHPLFLTAMVIDILTPEQETGIFTFRRDGSINSKGDLKQMYSLETLHKWAVDSEKFGFKPEDHFDILAESQEHSSSCTAIHLNNSSIIDACSLMTHASSGIAGWVQGYPISRNGNVEMVVKGISSSRYSNSSELIGCLMVGAHCSLPTVRKLAAEYFQSLKFVMFYSTSDENITVIPLISNELCLDDNYYGIESLEKLKIWTRRKR